MSYDSISFFCFVFLLWREAEIFYVYLMFIAIKLQYESILLAIIVLLRIMVIQLILCKIDFKILGILFYGSLAGVIYTFNCYSVLIFPIY